MELLVTSFLQIMKNRALAVLMLGHFSNDMLGGVLPILFPLMKLQYGLTNAQLGLVTLAFTAMSSLTQPIFGYFSDKYGRRWFVPITLIWGACFASAYGFATGFAMFIILAGLAGIGSGAFHPLGASNAAAVSGDENRNAAMSWYTVSGAVGYGLGPLIGTALLAAFGAHGTIWLLIPGFTAAALIWSQMHVVERARAARAAINRGLDAQPAWGIVSRIILISMTRSWVFLSVLQLSPIWYAELGFDRAFYGTLATVIIVSGAVGTLFGGNFADRFGQRRIIASSLALTIPALLIYAAFPGPQALILGAIFGFFCDASISVTLVMAQKLVPGRVGIASGVILGLGFVTGGIGVPITGRLADLFGMQIALSSLVVMLIAGTLLTFTLPATAAEVRAETQPDHTTRGSGNDRPAATGARR